MKDNHSTFLIMAITITLFVAGIYGYMYYTVETSINSAAKAQSMINSAQLSKEREGNFLETYTATATKWDKLQSIFVESGNMVNFIEAVELIGGQSGARVTISSIEADNLDNAPAGKEGTIRLRINAIGSWQSVMRALSLAETLPYKIAINSVTVTSSGISEPVKDEKVSPGAVWNMSFELHAAMIAVSSTTPTAIK